MHVVIVGRGQLAGELLTGLSEHRQFTVTAWPETPGAERSCVVVHAGSGRELSSVIDYCESSACPLIELATGSSLEGAHVGFPVVLCPNTNLLMLKVMSMLANSGHLFRGHAISVLESHQRSKTTEPGTALAIAAALGVPAAQVVSVRDPVVQRNNLAIAEEHLARHAVHRIQIQDGSCSATIETRVLGAAPYVQGVREIVAAIGRHKLDHRVYWIHELVETGWLSQRGETQPFAGAELNRHGPGLSD